MGMWLVLVWWKPQTTEFSRKTKNKISFLLLIVKQQSPKVNHKQGS